VGWGLALAALLMGLPVVAATGVLEAKQRAAGAADSAALAAADTIFGWLDGEPCAVAAEVAAAARVALASCTINGMEVRVLTRVNTPLGSAIARARAGPSVS
jgi:secretion/DNA translocation related TadE-like protein